MKPEYCKIAETLFGKIEWESQVLGFLKCPGEDLHTHPTRTNHCRVTLDGVPTIFCFHSSCSGPVKSANHRLRSAIARSELKPGLIDPTAARRKLTPADMAVLAKKQEEDELRAHSRKSLDAILKQNAIEIADFRELSPVRLLEGPTGDWKLLLQLFKPEDVIWIGNKFDSCSEICPKEITSEIWKVRQRAHLRFFRQVSEWLKEKNAPNQFTCPSTFKPGTFSRSNKNVVTRRFLVIESDCLTKPQMCAVINWCRQFMRLRAIVDTAGKSLHGWFDAVPPETEAKLRVILPNLGRADDEAENTLDPAMFKVAQPCRLPGALRDGNYQSLYYLDLA